MQITNVNITPLEDPNNDALLAFGSMTIDEEFVVRQLRIIETESKIFVAMPSERRDGEFRDIAHPITSDCRARIREAVLGEYNRLVPEDHELPEEPG